MTMPIWTRGSPPTPGFWWVKRSRHSLARVVEIIRSHPDLVDVCPLWACGYGHCESASIFRWHAKILEPVWQKRDKRSRAKRTGVSKKNDITIGEK